METARGRIIHAREEKAVILYTHCKMTCPTIRHEELDNTSQEQNFCA
jgi:hypothetical protein